MASTATERKLAAIMLADIAGFSSLMERNETATFERVRSLRENLTSPTITKHGGRVIKTTGDGFLAEFASATAALKCGIEIQRLNLEREAAQTETDRLHLRIGINLGDIIIDGDDVAGDGVNIAARLEPISPRDGICISASIRDQIREDLGVSFMDLGEQKLKNMERPVRAYGIDLAEPTSALDGFSVAKPVRGFGGRPAIAVLPFDNMSNDPEQEYFADGIAEDILTRLAMWRWMPVIGRNSSFVYRGKSVDLKKVGTELGARYILEGSVRKSGNRLRITGQLIDTDSGHHVWAQKYDKVLDDIFSLQDEVTEAIVAALEPAVGHAERVRVMGKGTHNLTAWELYHRGLAYLSELTVDTRKEAERLFLASAESDPQFATPLGGLTIVKMLGAMFGWTEPTAAIAEGYQAAQAAMKRDPLDPFVLTGMGMAYVLTGDYENALETCQKGVELNPSHALGRFRFGIIRLLNGHFPEAINEFEIAMRLNPNDFMFPNFLSALANAHYMNCSYDKAVELASYALNKTPKFALAQRNLANALAQLGRIEEGRQALESSLSLAPYYNTKAARTLMPFKNDSDFEHYMEGLRKLGWKG